jgi:hypothetical protein
MKGSNKIATCDQCKQALTEIDNRGERLVGCLTCNLWSVADGKWWKRLSEEDSAPFTHWCDIGEAWQGKGADRSRRLAP